MKAYLWEQQVTKKAKKSHEEVVSDRGRVQLMSEDNINTQNYHINDKDINFIEKSHQYYYKNKLLFRISATGLKGFFIPEFNEESILKMKFKNSHYENGELRIKRNEGSRTEQKDVGLSRHDILQKWKQAGVNGTYCHSCIELFLLSFKSQSEYDEMSTSERLSRILAMKPDVPPKFTPVFVQFFEIHNDLLRQRWTPYRSEWNVFDIDNMVAGGIDAVYVRSNKDTGNLEFNIVDWKVTGKVFKTVNGFDKEDKTMMYPLKHLPNSTLFAYNIQLNIYAYILQKHYDMNIVKMTIAQLNPEGGRCQVHDVPNLQKEVEDMMACWKNFLQIEKEVNLISEPLHPWKPTTPSPAFYTSKI